MHLFPSMWAYGHHFRTENADTGKITQDCGVEVKFDQSSRSSHRDQQLVWGTLGYVGKIQEIIEVDFSSFQCVIFRCKWWDTFDQNNVKEDHDSRLICINSRKMWDEAKEPYVFPKHCNQVFFYPDVLDRDLWFVLTHDPRSKHIFENNSVIMPCELEDNEGDHENREWYGTCVISSIFILFKMGFSKY